jgi:hypothetical protein|tara:strand:- start:578 stop:952 length:375 start_codon:yes stop_codon:yes gene_type:complete
MATNANWTIIFDDKMVIKNYAEGASQGIGYVVSDNSFWSDSKFSNIWAIQHGTSVSSDEIEYRDETPNSSYDDAGLGDISQFSSKWDAAHLSQLQADWDNDNVEDETADEKISRLGARPTSYSS